MRHHKFVERPAWGTYSGAIMDKVAETMKTMRQVVEETGASGIPLKDLFFEVARRLGMSQDYAEMALESFCEEFGAESDDIVRVPLH